MEGERAARVAHEEKHGHIVHRQTERIEELSAAHSAHTHDSAQLLKRSASDVDSTLQAHARTLMQSKSDHEAGLLEMNSKMMLLEQRTAYLEACIVEANERQMACEHRADVRVDKIAQGIESLREDSRTTDAELQTMNEKLEQCEYKVHVQDSETRAFCENERRQRISDVHRVHQLSAQERDMTLSGFEQKLHQRLQKEAEQRNAGLEHVWNHVRSETPPRASTPTNPTNAVIINTLPSTVAGPVRSVTPTASVRRGSFTVSVPVNPSMSHTMSMSPTMSLAIPETSQMLQPVTSAPTQPIVHTAAPSVVSVGTPTTATRTSMSLPISTMEKIRRQSMTM